MQKIRRYYIYPNRGSDTDWMYITFQILDITFQILSHCISDFVLNGHKKVIREIILMSDLSKVVLCLEKLKSKNLGQNQLTCFKNPKSPSCTDLMLINKPRSFQIKCVIETGLSDFHRITISVLKMHFRKLPPRVINYKDFKKIDNERFMNSLQYTLNEERIDCSKNPDKFVEVCLTVLNTHAPKKKNTWQ